MVTVLFVDLMLVQSQHVDVTNTISLTCIKEEKFVKFVMLDVIIVMEFSIIVPTVLLDLEDLVLHTVHVQMDI